MKTSFKALTVLLLFAAPALQAEQPQNANKVLLYVDDMPVTESYYLSFLSQKGYEMPADKEQQKALQTKVINELVNTLLMRREAEKLNLNASQQTRDALKIAENEVLSKALIADYLKNLQVTDQQLDQAYLEIQNEAKRRAEYKLYHILLDSEDEAIKLLETLSDKNSFISAAKQSSIDASKSQGGELGWVNSDVLEPEISQALYEINRGTHGKKPVKTRFGWHLLYVDDIKIQQVPPLAEIRTRLTELINQREIIKKVESLRKQATITKPEDKMKQLPKVE